MIWPATLRKWHWIERMLLKLLWSSYMYFGPGWWLDLCKFSGYKRGRYFWHRMGPKSVDTHFQSECMNGVVGQVTLQIAVILLILSAESAKRRDILKWCPLKWKKLVGCIIEEEQIETVNSIPDHDTANIIFSQNESLQLKWKLFVLKSTVVLSITSVVHSSGWIQI